MSIGQNQQFHRIQSCSSQSKNEWPRFFWTYLIPTNGKELLITSKCSLTVNCMVEWVVQYIIQDLISFAEIGCIVVAIHVIVLDNSHPIRKSHYSERCQCRNHGGMYLKRHGGTVVFKELYRFLKVIPHRWFRRCCTGAALFFLLLFFFSLRP